ncbi:unnamed protein product [Brassica oleracea var. botrytis]
MIRASQTFEESYQVFTLGDPKKQWRIIRGFGTFLSPTMTTRVCINFDLNKLATQKLINRHFPPESFMDGFFGYDPVENKYNVFCLIKARALIVQICGFWKIMPRNKNGVRLYCSSCLLLY